MQFGCESCKATLQIADEKVRGKRLVVRCKKCGAKITISDPALAGPAAVRPAPPKAQPQPEAEPDSDTESTRAMDSDLLEQALKASKREDPAGAAGASASSAGTQPAAAAAPRPPSPGPSAPLPPPPRDPAVWFAMLGGKQTGPLSRAEIALKVAQGAAGPRTYLWREGMATWTRAKEVGEMAALFSAAPPLPAPADSAREAGAVRGAASAASGERVAAAGAGAAPSSSSRPAEAPGRHAAPAPELAAPAAPLSAARGAPAALAGAVSSAAAPAKPGAPADHQARSGAAGPGSGPASEPGPGSGSRSGSGPGLGSGPGSGSGSGSASPSAPESAPRPAAEARSTPPGSAPARAVAAAPAGLAAPAAPPAAAPRASPLQPDALFSAGDSGPPSASLEGFPGGGPLPSGAPGSEQPVAPGPAVAGETAESAVDLARWASSELGKQPPSNPGLARLAPPTDPFSQVPDSPAFEARPHGERTGEVLAFAGVQRSRTPLLVALAIGALIVAAALVWALSSDAQQPPATKSETERPPAAAPAAAPPGGAADPAVTALAAKAAPAPAASSAPADKPGKKKPAALTSDQQADLKSLQNERGVGTHGPGPARAVEIPEVEKAEGGLTAEDVRKKLDQSKGALQGCIDEALRREPNLRVGKIHIATTIAPSGSVTATRIDKQTVDQSLLGACLKRATKRIVFPAFQGEAFEVDIPIVVTAGE